MPLILSETSQRLQQARQIGADRGEMPKRAEALAGIGGGLVSVAGDWIDIGLVNNVPDVALQATERQFIALLAAAAGDRPVRLAFFSLSAFARSEAAAAHIQAHYSTIDALDRSPLHALIVTGCDPLGASLADAPYWDSLVRLINWAGSNTVSTLWSCPAAYAAVLYLDGIRPHRLPRKRSGVYNFMQSTAHPLLTGVPNPLEVPHSRWNDLDAAELLAHGYQVLTASPEGGVDLFVKRDRSAFLFFQGHPEYEADSIAQEYRWDVGRYLRAERADYPGMPHNYFDSATETALAAFEDLARANRTALGGRDLPRQLALRPGLVEHWQSATMPIFRNWIALLGRERARF